MHDHTLKHLNPRAPLVLDTRDLPRRPGAMRVIQRVVRAPADLGTVELVVRRPADEQREVLAQAWLDAESGLGGDLWPTRIPKGMTSPDPEAQLTVANARALAAFAVDRSRWPMAGDQLFVDFDISESNLPPGSRLQVGDAVLEFSAKPHTGCKKFMARFGKDALAFTGTPVGCQLRLRGANARVVVPGVVRQGDPARKLPVHAAASRAGS